MRTLNIGILGLGTVGGGVVNVLRKNKNEIERHSGVNIRVTRAAVRTLEQTRICPTDTIELTQDPFSVVNHPDIEIILELMGGTGLAKELVELALRNGKSVITANKALIATHGNELLALAKQHKVHLLFEAAVAGGIPIIKTLEQSLNANQIELVAGIINGTGNFILSEMRDKHQDFEVALANAQALGYAEADPTFDVEGIDAAHKLAIMSAIAFGCELQFDQVSTQGIRAIQGEDIAFAAELGYAIKHLGIAKKSADTIEMRVQPALVPKTHLLASVDGVMNAVLVKGNALGETLYYGAGAGAEATASAVIADLVDILKGTLGDDILGWQSLQTFKNQTRDNVESIFYLRLLATDKAGVLADITAILANHSISVEAVIQKQIDQQNNAHIAMITNKISTKNMQTAVAEIQNHNFIQEAVKIIHVEKFD